MTTIYDIAAAAKTSPASVSRVLNGRGGVKADVVDRIKEAMERLDFQPRWKAIDRKRLLVLVPDTQQIFHSGYMARIMSGITDAAFSDGFGVQLRPFSSQGKDVRDLRQLYINEAVSGCILISLYQHGYSLPAKLDMVGLPYVVAGQKREEGEFHQVLLDDFEAGRKAAEYLLSLGHERISMVSFSHLDYGHRERYRGFAEVMGRAGTAHPPCIQSNESTYESGRSAARHLLTPREKPTAVIVTNEDIAAGFQSEAKTMGFSIPRDLSLIAFEESDKLSLLDTPITAMQTPAYMMGTEAVRMLHSILPGDKKGAAKAASDALVKHIPISLVARHSTAAVKL